MREPIVTLLGGSHLYGTSTEKSDKDLRGVYFEDPESYLSFLDNKGTIESMEHGVDSVFHEWRKFCKLVVQGNPNIVELLWAHSQAYLNKPSVAWPALLNIRDKLFSSATLNAFGGYARQQLGRLERGAGRQDYVVQYGYDVKDASHVLRLMDQALEIIEYGRITLPLPNAALYRSVKLGEITKDVLWSKHITHRVCSFEQALISVKAAPPPHIHSVESVTSLVDTVCRQELARYLRNKL